MEKFQIEHIQNYIAMIFTISEIITFFILRTLYKNYILHFFILDKSKFEEFSREENNEIIKLQTNDIFSYDNNYKRNKLIFNKSKSKRSNSKLLNLNKNRNLKLKTKDLFSIDTISMNSNKNLKKVNFLNPKKVKNKEFQEILV